MAEQEIGVLLRLTCSLRWAWQCPECATTNVTELSDPRTVRCLECTREFPCQTPKTLGGTS